MRSLGVQELNTVYHVKRLLAVCPLSSSSHAGNTPALETGGAMSRKVQGRFEGTPASATGGARPLGLFATPALDLYFERGAGATPHPHSINSNCGGGRYGLSLGCWSGSVWCAVIWGKLI